MNRTIMEHERYMILYEMFLLQFWADAVDIVVFLRHNYPSFSLDGGILEESWTCKKVNNSFLNTFSCESFVHINKKIEKILRQNQTNVPLLDMV